MKRLILSLFFLIPLYAYAIPLPDGTKLLIEKTTDADGLVPCTNGSCFGMFLAPGLYYWTAIPPGSDGGFIIGKAQKSGGQEVNGLVGTGGELTNSWKYGGNFGTFFTAPDASANIFDDQPCAGAACIGKTVLAVWNTAWGGQTIPMGSAAGCNKVKFTNCTADEVAGIFVNTWAIDPAGSVPRKWGLTYSQVVPDVFQNYPYALILGGTVVEVVATGKPRATLIVDKATPNIGELVTFTATCVNEKNCDLTQTEGPQVVIANNSFTPSEDGKYVFRLTASNNGVDPNTSDATVTVQKSAPPVQASTNEGCSIGSSTKKIGGEWWIMLVFLSILGCLIWRKSCLGKLC